MTGVPVLTMLLRSSFRQRWRSWLSLCLLIAVVTGLVLAAAAAGRRTATAFPRYEAAYGYDAFVFSDGAPPDMARFPEVASATLELYPLVGNVTCDCGSQIGASESNDFNVGELSPKDLPHMVKLVAGRMPEQSDPDEVLASYTLQQENGVHVGTVFHLSFYAASQRSAVLSNNNLAPRGPTVTLHVVGIEAAEVEFPSTNSPSYDLFTTSALARAIDPKAVVFSAEFVRLRHGAADIPRLQAQGRGLGLAVDNLDGQANSVDSSIHPQAVGWWILAGLAAVVAMIVMSQALSRQATTEADDYSTLIALGISRRQLMALTMAKTLIVGVAGVILGLAVAFALSPVTLVGEARLADPTPGFSFDALVLLLGGAVAAAVVLALGVWPAVRTARVRRPGESEAVVRRSRIVGFLAAAGAPPSALIGVRHALERGRGRNAVPSGAALLGSILAVTALCATAVFGASLTHLTSTPALYGQAFDASFGIDDTASPAQAEQMVSSIERQAALRDITAGIGVDTSINGKIVNALGGQALRGSILLTAVNGRLPSAANEVALGASTMRQVGAHVGSLVHVSVTGGRGRVRTSSYRVVGTATFPPDFGVDGLGTGAFFTVEGLLGNQCPAGPSQVACQVRAVINSQGALLVRAAPDREGDAALATLARAWPVEVAYPVPPTNLVNFGEAVNFPLLFGLILIVFGVATLGHALVLSVARRRREVGLLKALGFVRRQVAFCVSWQTTTVALVGIIVGVPAGIVVGRIVWRAFATNLGVLPVPVVIAWVIVAVAAGTVAVAHVLAIGPALVAARQRPASLLRAE